MSFSRESGILLHPTSFPARFGNGDLGKHAYEFIDFLHSSSQKLWQILPLGPAGYGDSPYASYSAFAGNPFLINLDILIEEGFLEKSIYTDNKLPKKVANWEDGQKIKLKLLRKAFSNFINSQNSNLWKEFHYYCNLPTISFWLYDFAFFMALKLAHNNIPWHLWKPELASRQPHAMAVAKERLNDEIEFQKFLQWQFDRQWAKLVRYAHKKQIKIIGDIPIYVLDDSSDAWSNKDMFFLDKECKKTVVAGVPPDYFSKTGQLWGNPLYKWEYIHKNGYSWWINRFKTLIERVDIIRLDHFRGFESYWEIPAEAPTAEHGVWRKGPGIHLFRALHHSLGRIPIIAEDLGIITNEVNELREALNLPGMKILQFAFGGENTNPYLPHNYTKDTAVYTGTHDNDTLAGWIKSSNQETKKHLQSYLGGKVSNVADAVIRLALSSVANTCVIPLQDWLKLSSKYRMNTPGVTDGNWKWQYKDGVLKDSLSKYIRELTELYGR